MKRNLLFWALAALLCVPQALRAENKAPFTIPEITHWQGGEGRYVPTASARIVAGTDAEQVARQLAADYRQMFGKTLKVVAKAPAEGNITLRRVSDASLGDEGYRFTVGRGVLIEGQTDQALLWGTRTLLQIAEQSTDRSLPCGTATDRPQFAMRGFMIDCGRKFIPMSYLQKLIRVMAYYKMNTLQVHLNDCAFPAYFDDDWEKTYAAFRLQSDWFPGLTAKDGFYTKKDFRQLQSDARSMGVTIVPEIDVPAHSLCFSHYRPELGSKKYGPDHLDLFNPAVYTFIDSLFTEYIAGPDPVFTGPYVHVGTDEYSNADTAVVERFRYFTDHCIRLVERLGKKAAVWGSLTHAKGHTPVKSNGVLMNLWYNGYAAPLDMKREGFDLLCIPDGYVYIVPAAGYYYDYLNTQFLYDKWTPRVVGDVTLEAGDPQLRGGMFAVWNDHCGNGITVRDVHHRVMPALQVVATKCWTADGTARPYAEYEAGRQLLSEAPGVNFLARPKGEKRCVLSLPTLKAGSRLPMEAIGYDWSVSFKLSGKSEAKGTALTLDDDATLWLSDPVAGMMAFSRDNYTDELNYRVAEGEEAEILLEGTNRWTRLYVNGRLVSNLEPHTILCGKAKKAMHLQRTLVFPLEKTGAFKSRVSDFRVYNYLLRP